MEIKFDKRNYRKHSDSNKRKINFGKRMSVEYYGMLRANKKR